jgi:succinyl-CoA synthetase beta subunit
VIFINIFGGIMKCDIIAEGVVSAAKEIGIKIPVVARLEGTNVDLGRAIIKQSGLPIIAATSMADGARRAIKAAREAAL